MEHLFVMAKTDTFDLETAQVKEVAMLRTTETGNQILAVVGTDMQDFRDIADGKYVIISYFGSEFYKPLLEKYWGKNNVLAKHTWVNLEQLAWPLMFDDAIKDRSIQSLGKHLGLVSPDALWLLNQSYWTLMRRLTTGIFLEEKARKKGGRWFEAAQQFVRRF